MSYKIVHKNILSISADELITRMDELLGCGAGNRDIEIKGIVSEESESFGARFFRLVDEKGFTDSQVYNKAKF